MKTIAIGVGENENIIQACHIFKEKHTKTELRLVYSDEDLIKLNDKLKNDKDNYLNKINLYSDFIVTISDFVFAKIITICRKYQIFYSLFAFFLSSRFSSFEKANIFVNLWRKTK